MKGKGGLGFKFVGSITLQAFLLQNGLLNGHSHTCPKNPRCAACTPCSPPNGQPNRPPPVSSPRGRAAATSTSTSTTATEPSTKGPTTPKRTAAAATLKDKLKEPTTAGGRSAAVTAARKRSRTV